MDPDQIETVTLEEAAQKFDRKWLGVRVVERDKESGQPLTVKILSRNVDVGAIRSNIGMDDVCVLYTGPIPEPHNVLMF